MTAHKLLKNGLVYGRGDTDVLISGNRIAEIGTDISVPMNSEIIDCSDCLLFPGLINTHHHLAQSILKAVPAGINHRLGDWLVSVPYKYWPNFTPEMVYTAARIGFAEQLRAGCTTCADHHYLYHSNQSNDMEDAIFQAAAEMGIRLLLCRGGNTHVGTHQGSATTEKTPETIEQFLQRMEASVAKYHNTADDAMTRMVMAPTSMIHTSPADHLRLMADFARKNGLHMHTHLLEAIRDQEVALFSHGMSAIDYAADVGWLGEDVWFAHMVQADEHAIKILGATHTGIAHCPTSNARLGSGIAPIPELEAAGATISLGVDGSASAESGSPVNELMFAWLVHRTRGEADISKVEQCIDWATTGGAKVLGFPTLGKIESGMLADIAIYDLHQPRLAGLFETQWAPAVAGEPMITRHLLINGHWSIKDNEILGVDTGKLVSEARAQATALMAS